MECTQRLECTQDAYDICPEKAFPEQIGFLGICGMKHPIKKGPNKIGRDPQTCSIVLNDNSISRQHAVINILNKSNFMLMDLDSANKTKLLDKTLQPYIPQPLQNGDTVQFGTLFGIFRLFEENDDLPMTQAVEIPETPVYPRTMSRLKPAQITTVPESPDVSDRDDSIIGQSPKKKIYYKSPNNSFIKSKTKIIDTHGIDTNKINNVYWASSKKSDSFSSIIENNSSYTINRSSNSPKKLPLESSIYDMETQVPGLPSVDETSHSIYEADTQVPRNKDPMNIYNCETQVPNVVKLPEVFKVRDQSNVQLNLYSINENDDIFEAETQVVQHKEENLAPTHSNVIISKNIDAISDIHKKLNSSDEEICFDEIDGQENEEECGSQPLLPPDLDDIVPIVDKENRDVKENETKSITILNDSETKDCDEIAPSQVVIETKDDEDLTDCEDNMIELVVNKANQPNKVDDDETDCEDDSKPVASKQKASTGDDDLTDCEDEVIQVSQNTSKVSNLPEGFDDLPTQVIGEENTDKLEKCKSGNDDVPFDEMLTQVIDEYPVESDVVQKENNPNKTDPFEDLQTQVIDVEIPQDQSSASKQIESYSNFKLPLSSPKLRKKPVTSLKSSKPTKLITNVNLQSNQDDQNYYSATQEIFNDLCTQNEQSDTTHGTKNEEIVTEKQFEHDEDTKKIDSFVCKLSKEQVRRVIGVDESVATLSKQKSSDSSDLEVTPKKFNVSKFLMIDLPNSQDIKSCDFITSKADETDSSDGLELEENSQDSPQICSNKIRRKKDIKLDLMKKFDVSSLPTRAITRIRKPTSKLLDCDSNSKKMTERILQSNLGLDKEHEIDREIVELNLRRLRSKMEKAKNKTSSRNIKSEINETDATSILVKKEHKQDKTESKEHKLPHKTEKVSQQQNIKEIPSKDIELAETDRNVKSTSESTNSSKTHRRSSRNRSKNDKEVTERKSKDSIKSSGTTKSSSRRSRKKPCSPAEEKETIDLTKNKETEVRRSRRNQSSKEKIKDDKQKLHSKRTSELSRTVDSDHTELSRVYNLSSETADDASINLKRQASGDIFASKTKKAKSSNAENTSTRTLSLRGVKTQYVLFTAFPSIEVKQKLEKLGAVIVTEVKQCTVLLTLHIKRTFKLLCAVGLGKPIVGPTWVQACADSNMIVDPWLYLMKDEVSEKRFGFNLRQSLTCKRNYLKGCNVYCTPNVTPRPEEMRSIVECSGGTWKEGGRSWYCVTCQTDRGLWAELRRRGAVMVSTEFVLGGVLQQRMNLERDRLL